MMIYVPNYVTTDYVTIISQGVVRVYDTEPIVNTEISYTDFYINDDYMSLSGVELISSIPNYVTSSSLTDNFYYRVDFPDILLMFTLFCLWVIYIPIKVVSRLFRRFL